LKEYFVIGTEPTEESDYWTVPLPIRDLHVTLSGESNPWITFSCRQGYINYKLYREDYLGNRVLIRVFSGANGDVTYEDTNAIGGNTYVYFVVPEHPELNIGGNKVIGPESVRIRLSVPQKPDQEIIIEDDEFIEIEDNEFGDDDGMVETTMP